jgi:flagellar hook-basal body complex protein FliE
MIIPPIGGLSGALSSQPGANPAEALQGGAGAGQAEGHAQGLEGTSGIEGTSGVEGARGIEGASGVEGTSGGTTSFGSSLTEAISSLEQTQRSSDSAAQALASGTVKDPEAAVTTVEDAALAMQLAAQIRTKATEAAQTIFQTQV